MVRYSYIIAFFILCSSCSELSQKTKGDSVPSILLENNDAVDLKDRTSWQKPTLIFEKLGELSDKTVADIGAGTGYFSFRLMHKVGKIIAIDIDSSMINLIEAFKTTMDESSQSKLETRLATPNDPLLKQDEADIILFVNVISYIEDRVTYLTNLHSKLPSTGKIVIVDFKTKRLPIDAPPYEERVLQHIIEEELYMAGYNNIVIDDSLLDFQYLITAEK